MAKKIKNPFAAIGEVIGNLKLPVKILLVLLIIGAIGGTSFYIYQMKLAEERAMAEAMDFSLKPLDVSQLQGGQFYVRTGNIYYGLIRGQFRSTIEKDSIIPEKANPETRYTMFGENDQQIPTLYKDGELIYKSNEPQLPSEFVFERFKDQGWSIGIRGITKAEGFGKYHTIVNAHTYREGSSISQLNAPAGGEVIIDKVNGTPLSENNVSEAGTITGLTKGQSYSVDAYTGTTYIGMEALADTHMLSSYEIYKISDYSLDPNNYVVIKIPDYLQSGYYMINGMGLIRYINRSISEGDVGVDLNIPYYMGKDDSGNMITNPADGEGTVTQENKKTSTEDFEWTYTVTIDNPQKEFNMTVTFTDAMAIVNGELLYEKDGAVIPGATIPSATLIGPDGTEYQLTTDKEGYKMTTKVENPGTGTWILTVKGMYARTFDVSSGFEGNTSNMIVKDSSEDMEMKVYFDKPLEDGVFNFTWSDTSHAANFQYKQGDKVLYETEKDQSKIIAQSYGQMTLHMGPVEAGEYSFIVKGESLGHVYFTYADAATLTAETEAETEAAKE